MNRIFHVKIAGGTYLFLILLTAVMNILIPLLDGIAFPVEQVQLGITYLRIIRYKQEEILEITDTAHGLSLIHIFCSGSWWACPPIC